MDIFKNIFEKLNLKEVSIIAVIFCSFITFMPDNYIEYLNLYQLKEKYQSHISIFLIISFSYLMIRFTLYVGKIILRKLYSPKRIIKYMIKNMSAEEMGLLIKVFYDKRFNKFITTGTISITNGLIAPLEFYKIIYCSSQINVESFCFTYNLQPYALNFLNKNLKNGNIDIINSRYILTK